MEETDSYIFLRFHLKILRIVSLWPNEGENTRETWRDLILIIILLPTSLTVTADGFLSIGDAGIHINEVIQSLIAGICIIGVHYSLTCFLINRDKINRLVERIKDFEQFAPLDEIIEVDKSAQFFARGLMFYTTIAPIIYVTIPVLPISIEVCKATQSENRIQKGIPCGLVAGARFPFQFNYTPLKELVYLHQAFLSFIISWIIIMLTLLLCGVLSQVTYHFRKIKMKLLDLQKCDAEKVSDEVTKCILYHIETIRFCDDINDAFSSQNFLHVSLTSLVISVLGFELLFIDIIGRIRFTLNLIGWIFMLLLVCYFGQVLIDESSAVSEAAYNTNWYEMPVHVQKKFILIIKRGQKPSRLKAANLGFMSFPTFLKVMKSAYSYFTLLLNIM